MFWTPKHQKIINRCYPRMGKVAAVEVKPNSSELSYLLYYASTRKIKLHKLGVYFEEKTRSDVKNGRLRYVSRT